jgi:hypothetical protein
MPNEHAEMAPTRGVIKPGTKVKTLAVERWQDTVFVWAKIAY